MMSGLHLMMEGSWVSTVHNFFLMLLLLNLLPLLFPLLALQHSVPRRMWAFFSSQALRLLRRAHLQWCFQQWWLQITEVANLCSNRLVCSWAVVARTPWESNPPASPLCSAGLAELGDVVRLLQLVPRRVDWACQQCPAVSRWQRAMCVALLRSQSRARGGCAEGWQLFSLAGPAMLNVNLNHG